LLIISPSGWSAVRHPWHPEVVIVRTTVPGLGVARAVAADLESGVHLDRIQADLDGGADAGVQGTPTFFTNGVRHDASYAASELLAALRATAPGA
jgi:hypothetical protein